MLPLSRSSLPSSGVFNTIAIVVVIARRRRRRRRRRRDGGPERGR